MTEPVTRIPYIPITLTPADVDLALGQLYAEDVAPILDALLAAGCPPGEVEARATALVDAVAEDFGSAEPGRGRRWAARAYLAWLRLRRWWRPDPPAPWTSRPAILLLADLWVTMATTRAIRRDRIPLILRGAIRVGCVERQVRTLVEGV